MINPIMSPVLATGALLLLLGAVTSCATSSRAGGFDAPVPAARLYAIERARAEGDRSPATLRRLIEQLDSDDAAVRLLAITTLEELTGETYGYEHDDAVAARREAIARWLDHPGIGPGGASDVTNMTETSGIAEHG